MIQWHQQRAEDCHLSHSLEPLGSQTFRRKGLVITDRQPWRWVWLCFLIRLVLTKQRGLMNIRLVLHVWWSGLYSLIFNAIRCVCVVLHVWWSGLYSLIFNSIRCVCVCVCVCVSCFMCGEVAYTPWSLTPSAVCVFVCVFVCVCVVLHV